MPAHWYFTSALPRALLGVYPLALASLYLSPRTRQLVWLPLLFVAIYSLLPHKELRFVLYAAPPLNAAAAAALARMYRALPAADAPRAPARALALTGRALALVGALGSFFAVGAFAAAAHGNYAGGAALAHVHGLGARQAASSARPLAVHIGVDAAVSGVSRFLEKPNPWRYSKAEGLAAADYRQFSYALTEPGASLPGFTRVHVQHGFDKVSRAPPHFRFAPRVQVLRRGSEQRSRMGSGETFDI